MHIWSKIHECVCACVHFSSASLLVCSSTGGTSSSSHQAAPHSSSAPPLCVMCTASEIYRSINKTIKQQFSLLLPHCTATEYIHFSFPLSRTSMSGSEGEWERKWEGKERVRRGKGGTMAEWWHHHVERCSRGREWGRICRKGYERKSKTER